MLYDSVQNRIDSKLNIFESLKKYLNEKYEFNRFVSRKSKMRSFSTPLQINVR